ncbi:MAG: malto-oligosyltrehalose synthase [Akkermansiaceae bacterium]
MHADLGCTYRVQLSASFDLNEAAAITDYLADLGVTHIYLSPLLQAASGSDHGYDATDPTRVSNTLGGEEGLEAISKALRQQSMAAIIDIVPNHLAACAENPWWWDILHHGKNSVYADIFDIDWNPPDPELKNKLLLPLLGDHPGKVLASGELCLTEENGIPLFRYYEDRFPINEEGREMLSQGEAGIDPLLKVQFYRLAYWKIGPEQINYRRFFDIQTLAGIRTEDPQVFLATHAKLFEILHSAPIDGLRIDHPDGLRDPAKYFTDLRQATSNQWLLVEKILGPREMLPNSWPVDGTTGYDFLQRVGGLFISSKDEASISDFYADFTGNAMPYGALVRSKKRRVLTQAFAADIRRLVELLKTICDHVPLKVDYSRRLLHELLTEILANFPIYRTYVNPARGEITAQDREAIHQALESTRRRDQPFEEDLIKTLENILTAAGTRRPETDDFIARFQQLTGPVMAKGVEDTTFYSYNRLLALNDVGCDPARFGVSTQEFHQACLVAQREWPRGMLTTSTHDTKRSEDVRARIALLSEIPAQWAEQVRRWSSHNHSAWHGREPDRNAEYFFYQTLVGAWPIESKRMELHMQKACREAKDYTSWTAPDEAYEAKIKEFTHSVLADASFIKLLQSFVAPLVPLGWVNSLAQTLLKLTTPGVPDIYQGCEIWDNSLVDPDNRRPVNYQIRRKMLETLRSGMGVAEVMARADEGFPKLHTIHTSLAVRRRLPAAFAAGPQGAYRPLLVGGRKLAHVVAFCRGQSIAVIVPRLIHTVAGDWGDTTIDLGEGDWLSEFDLTAKQGVVKAAELFRHFPIALLTRSDP